VYRSEQEGIGARGEEGYRSKRRVARSEHAIVLHINTLLEKDVC
jgi:hypothetical protein